MVALPNDQSQLLLIVKTLPIILLPLLDQKFRLVKVLESELPLDQFLKRNASSVRAMIASHATSVNADLLQLLRTLRMVVTSSAGVNQVDLAECRRRVVSVANVGNSYSKDVANMVVGLLIDVLRKAASDCYVRHGFWKVKGDFPLPHKVSL
ncbi:glyoxylate/hydroxypyruvate reductase HPR3-like [Cannabis sativa]|uniref:glyoxylate/hydroxypyruvate reductase HPR3-like n=1 Tax=Cannabis sativa TaxID=3483 RepID=UPI0029C9E162|nr:glyoxylate/hydroxypyruvate reductase HPR3-like [Cannabis sativa]